MLETSKNPGNSEILPAYQKRLDAIMKKLAEKKGCNAHSFEIKELVGEYDFVSKQLYQMEDVSKMLLEVAELYQTNQKIQKCRPAFMEKAQLNFLEKL